MIFNCATSKDGIGGVTLVGISSIIPVNVYCPAVSEALILIVPVGPPFIIYAIGLAAYVVMKVGYCAIPVVGEIESSNSAILSAGTFAV